MRKFTLEHMVRRIAKCCPSTSTI